MRYASRLREGARPAAPLREHAALSRATALVAGGRKLDDALKASGYRAQRTVHITVRGAHRGPRR